MSTCAISLATVRSGRREFGQDLPYRLTDRLFRIVALAHPAIGPAAPHQALVVSIDDVEHQRALFTGFHITANRHYHAAETGGEGVDETEAETRPAALDLLFTRGVVGNDEIGSLTGCDLQITASSKFPDHRLLDP